MGLAINSENISCILRKVMSVILTANYQRCNEIEQMETRESHMQSIQVYKKKKETLLNP